MADKNIQMEQRNATNDGWDSIYPITVASNVNCSNGKSVDSQLAEIVNSKGQPNGIAPLDSNSKIPSNFVKSSNAELTKYAYVTEVIFQQTQTSNSSTPSLYNFNISNVYKYVEIEVSVDMLQAAIMVYCNDVLNYNKSNISLAITEKIITDTIGEKRNTTIATFGNWIDSLSPTAVGVKGLKYNDNKISIKTYFDAGGRANCTVKIIGYK
ncbi:hypothetical protein [Clostridium gasigenes]|uniref:Uncharacterized protein n=1 Tax=Clostridium gasigenes TaxID=94869 RepID=A0A7X0SES8_9CLOT|nr:hypothetical protein [Clostridium gasigenes]MBB6716278.1 hypothetical protein [Clostridium gasigenes]